MIFINANLESTLQVNDKTRLDASKTFVSGSGPITDILIKPEASESFISVFNANPEKWFIDWAYSTAGTKTISVEVTDGVDTVSKDFTIEVLSVADDNLYSNDSELFLLESELKRYLPIGKSSFLNIHREAQSRIVSYFDRKRIWKDGAVAYDKDELNINGELSKWSLYETALIIYTDLLVSVGDKFAEKVNTYKELRNFERDRGAVRLDSDGDAGDEFRVNDLKSFRLIRR